MGKLEVEKSGVRYVRRKVTKTQEHRMMSYFSDDKSLALAKLLSYKLVKRPILFVKIVWKQIPSKTM